MIDFDILIWYQSLVKITPHHQDNDPINATEDRRLVGALQYLAFHYNKNLIEYTKMTT